MCYDFADSDGGFTAIFADYPAGEGVDSFYELRSGYTEVPVPRAGMGLFLSGNNHSDGLFMGWYPSSRYGYIGFFMMNKRLQGRQIGSGIVRDVFQYLEELGFTAVRLGIDKENSQSTHFGGKNGFDVIKEVDQDGWTVLVAEKTL